MDQSDIIRQNSEVIREYYLLLFESLLEFQVLGHLVNVQVGFGEESDRDPFQHNRRQLINRVDQAESDFAGLNEKQQDGCKNAVISYAMFRTVGRISEFPKLGGRAFPTHSAIVHELTQLARGWIRRLQSVLKDDGLDDPNESDMRLCSHLLQDLRSDQPRVPDIESVRLGLWREYSWAEEIIQQDPRIPNDTRFRFESRDAEIDRISKSLPGKKGQIFRFLAKKENRHGVTFNALSEAEDKDSKQRLTTSENFNSIAAMMRKLSQQLTDYGWSVSASIQTNLVKLEKLNESKQ